MPNRWAGPLIAILIALSGCATTSYETLDARAWKEAYEATPDAILLDVRTPEEFAQGHIEGATLIPHTEIRDADLPDVPFFVYCRSGSRSAQASAELAEMGHNVTNLDGGILAWVQAGYPIV